MKALTYTCHYTLCSYEELCEQDQRLIDAAKASTSSKEVPTNFSPSPSTPRS